MTDKEKIIDGKTIGCPCYIDRPLHRYDKACSIQSQAFTEQQTKEKPILRCDQIKNCPIKENYKQLKAKEQECEELREDRERWKSNFNGKVSAIEELLQQLDQLKAENKELKQYKTLYEKTRNLWNKARMNNYELLDEIKDLKDSLKRTVCQSECYKHKEADKLKQTLTEIKEIAEGAKKDICNNCGWRNTDSCDPEDYTCGEFIKILQKISEVNNDR